MSAKGTQRGMTVLPPEEAARRVQQQYLDQHHGHFGGHYEVGEGWNTADAAGLVSVEVHSVVDVPRVQNQYGKFEQGSYFLQATTLDGKQKSDYLGPLYAPIGPSDSTAELENVVLNPITSPGGNRIRLPFWMEQVPILKVPVFCYSPQPQNYLFETRLGTGNW